MLNRLNVQYFWEKVEEVKVDKVWKVRDCGMKKVKKLVKKDILVFEVYFFSWGEVEMIFEVKKWFDVEVCVQLRCYELIYFEIELIVLECEKWLKEFFEWIMMVFGFLVDGGIC